MYKILGVDPALNNFGFAIISIGKKNETQEVIEAGVIKGNSKETEFARVSSILSKLDEIHKKEKLNLIFIESQFIKLNPRTSLSLATVKGAIFGFAALNEIKIEEVNPKEVKKYITGNGNAKKEEIEKMLKIMFPDIKLKQHDESDALAIAISGYFLNKAKRLYSIYS